MVLPKGYVNSPATVHNIFGRDIDNIMLIKPDKGEVSNMLKILVECMNSRGWEINPMKYQGLLQ